MVISQFSFVGYDHLLLTYILCVVLALAAAVIWRWNRKKVPISILLAIATLLAFTFIRPPNAITNLVVLMVMAGGAGLESKYLRTSRGFLWVLVYAVWTAGNLVYDYKTPHSVRLRQDTIIDQHGDLLTIIKRPAVHVVHAMRKVSVLKLDLEFWSIEDNDQAVEIFGNELYSDLSGRLLTGRGLANEIAKWAHTKVIEKHLPDQSLIIKPWENPNPVKRQP